MGPDFSRFNAEVLERALAARRIQLEAIDSYEERERLEGALTAIEGYMALLREPAEPSYQRSLVRYAFMLVFPDGRWSLDEKQLPDLPRAGDVVVFDAGRWRIERSQKVGVKPAGKPAREFFVCAPAGA